MNMQSEFIEILMMEPPTWQQKLLFLILF